MQAIELFAGAGGLGIGISRAGFSTAAVVEWDKWCCDTLRENRASGVAPLSKWPAPIEADVRSIDFKKYEAKVDLVTGGPPCQPFSLGGRHQAQDDTRDMWPEAVRAVREIQPKAFVFENVKGLMRSTFTSYRNYIHLQLQHPSLKRKKTESWADHNARLQRHHTSGGKIEYRVLDPEILNAADYGIPQRRERVLFVGFRADLGIEWQFPTETHSLDALLWDQVHSGDYWDRHGVAKKQRLISPRLRERAKRLTAQPLVSAWRTVRDAISDLPDPELSPRLAAEIMNHKFQGGARSYPGHTGSPMDEPAKTLKAGVHGVPGGENMLARPDGSVRYFTVREAARLQTFPDQFKFHGSWSETMRQLGNAVPVDLAEVIGRDVMKRLKASAKS